MNYHLFDDIYPILLFIHPLLIIPKDKKCSGVERNFWKGYSCIGAAPGLRGYWKQQGLSVRFEVQSGLFNQLIEQLTEVILLLGGFQPPHLKGRYTTQCTDNVLLHCALETCMVMQTNVTPINSIENKIKEIEKKDQGFGQMTFKISLITDI